MYFPMEQSGRFNAITVRTNRSKIHKPTRLRLPGSTLENYLPALFQRFAFRAKMVSGKPNGRMGKIRSRRQVRYANLPFNWSILMSRLRPALFVWAKSMPHRVDENLLRAKMLILHLTALHAT